MKLLLILSSLAMPVIAWLSQAGMFGPDNATLSDRYPTLLVAAGYAFSIWGLIFALDVAYALRRALHAGPAAPQQLPALVSAGFALTAGWMIVFAQQLFWLALLVIWAALACLLQAALLLARRPGPRRERWIGLVPLGLHAGWLSLAAFLNTAQVVVAYELLPTADMLSWSLLLWAAAAALLLWANTRLQGHPAYALAALWGLVGVAVEQSRSGLAGAAASAGVAMALAAVLAAQTLYLQWRSRRTAPPPALS